MDLEIPVFFILCKGRSGSTLLQTTLNAHPQILVPFESRFFIYLYKKYASKTNWTTRDLNHFFNDLFLDDRFRELWKVDKTHLKKALLSEPQNTSFSQLYKIVCLHHQKEEDPIHLIGDKNPVNCLFIKEIKDVFPEAKFIHLIRDPRDVCLSQITNFSVESLAIAAQKWKLYNKSIERHKAENSSNFFTLRYEDLVKNPSQEIKRICTFLEVDFKKEMLNKENRKREHLHISEELKIKKRHGKVLKTITTKSIGKWKNGLTEKQVKKIEGITGKLLKKYQYEKAFAKGKPATFVEKCYFHFKMKRLESYYRTPIAVRKYYRKLVGKSHNFAGK